MKSKFTYHANFWVQEYKNRALARFSRKLSPLNSHRLVRQLEIQGSPPQLDLTWRIPRTNAILTHIHTFSAPEVSVTPEQSGVHLEEGRYWPPLRVFELHDVKLDIFSGLVFSDGWVVTQSGYGHRWTCDAAFITGATRRIRDLASKQEKRNVAMLGDVVHHYHFLIETLPRVLRLRDVCPDITFLTVDTPTELAGELLRQVGARFEIVEEESIVEGPSIWVHEPAPRDWPHREDLVLLCDAFLEEGRKLVADSKPRVYISRSGSARSLQNESVLEAWLAERGFLIAHLQDLPFLEQVGLMSQAEFVVAPHGAGLANIAFMPPGGRVIELSSGEWISPAFRRIAAQRGLNYSLLGLTGTSAAPWGDAEGAIQALIPHLGEIH